MTALDMLSDVTAKELGLLEKILKEQPPDITPKQMISVKDFYKEGNHVLILGKTGSGKTVLLLNLIKKFLEHGFRVIHRDDGGLEFLKLLDFVDEIAVMKPSTCYFNVASDKVIIYDYDVEKPYELVKFLLDSKHQFMVILFDVYCKDKELAADFWSEFFDAFITILMQRHVSVKRKVVLSFDEINDIIQPQKMELTPVHRKVRALVEYNIRKLRKHKVKLVCTSHRPNQLTLNIRSQFSYVFVKQSFGYDLYQFLNKELVHIGSRLFFKILRDIKDLDVAYAYLFDKKGYFDKLMFPNLPEYLPYYEIEGILELPKKTDWLAIDRKKRRDIIILLEYIKNKRETGNALYHIIGEKYGIPYPTVRYIVNKLLEDPKIANLCYKLITSEKTSYVDISHTKKPKKKSSTKASKSNTK